MAPSMIRWSNASVRSPPVRWSPVPLATTPLENEIVEDAECFLVLFPGNFSAEMGMLMCPMGRKVLPHQTHRNVVAARRSKRYGDIYH
jgi:hypothetical protein